MQSILDFLGEVGLFPVPGLLLSLVFDPVQGLVLNAQLPQLDGQKILFPNDSDEFLLAALHLRRALDQQLLHVPELSRQHVILVNQWAHLVILCS